VLLHENVPGGPLVLLGYAGCVVVIIASTVRLANPPSPAKADQRE
jgi:hypothetical protein